MALVGQRERLQSPLGGLERRLESLEGRAGEAAVLGERVDELEVVSLKTRLAKANLERTISLRDEKRLAVGQVQLPSITIIGGEEL